ncbi:unnamed protein product, partial [Closterium sp. NIES-64]
GGIGAHQRVLSASGRMGVRVRLDLRHLPSFSLFPGQILAVEGSNPSGYCLVAKRIVAALPYQPEVIALDEIEEMRKHDGGDEGEASCEGGEGSKVDRENEVEGGKVKGEVGEEEKKEDGEGGVEKGTEEKVGGDAAGGGNVASGSDAAEVQERVEAGTEGMDTEGVRAVESGAAGVKAEGNEEEEEDDDEMRIIAAAGPFTTIDSWSFEPLKDLIKFALQRPPDVLLLVGPFIDREHPDARDGCVEHTYEALFQQHIRAQVKKGDGQVGGQRGKARRTRKLCRPHLRGALSAAHPRTGEDGEGRAGGAGRRPWGPTGKAAQVWTRVTRRMRHLQGAAAPVTASAAAAILTNLFFPLPTPSAPIAFYSLLSACVLWWRSIVSGQEAPARGHVQGAAAAIIERRPPRHLKTLFSSSAPPCFSFPPVSPAPAPPLRWKSFPPFDSSDFEDPRKQVLMLGNPSELLYISLFGTLFHLSPSLHVSSLPLTHLTLKTHVGIACSSTDILRHLSKEEIARVAPGDSATSDRMSRLAAHVIGQRSFYPLFPPPPATCLDLSCCPQALDLPFAPHLLFLPSDLVPFVKVSLPLPSPSFSTSLHFLSLALPSPARHLSRPLLLPPSLGPPLCSSPPLPPIRPRALCQGEPSSFLNNFPFHATCLDLSCCPLVSSFLSSPPLPPIRPRPLCQALVLPFAPHLLFLPSDLVPFVKVSSPPSLLTPSPSPLSVGESHLLFSVHYHTPSLPSPTPATCLDLS